MLRSALACLSVLALASSQNITYSTRDGRPTCTVHPGKSNATDDVPTIVQAFKDCGSNGNVVFPAGNTYHINSRLNPVLNDVTIDWQGEWLFSEDLDYWRNNSYHIEFQNHAAGFVITGDHIRIDGHGTGGIDGNGQVWYYAERGNPPPGRPMPFVFWNVSDVTVKNFHVVQPQLWSINIMNGTDMVFDNIYTNATSPEAPEGYNWVQNTDGFNTMDATNIHLTNFIYQGGDDCIAIKPRSTNIYMRNITCHSGNGIAIGSLGQYLDDASVSNVHIDGARIIKGGAQNSIGNAAYIKTWVGELVSGGDRDYESDYQPRGAGWGSVTNMLFSNFEVFGAKAGGVISQNSGDNGSFAGTSNMLVSNVAFVNFTGYLDNKATTASVSCSTRQPCYNIEYKNYTLYTSANMSSTGTAKCKWTEQGGVHGVAC
ncbi:glycoside hydrolase family 28 protein [Lophiostoma macrostomum CBS 122681]|uniref:galacturonan 1,4-alpha-galacturonidase n=1 Tax=Lophiostoma macrostomum CBS 122681 TaxID=1314788 RepID=A0A6A6TPM9_9PLEO|nr:glycoside hydrolase family 28 protein [Lophiostoma macrostomum CBS 122681]